MQRRFPLLATFAAVLGCAAPAHADIAQLKGACTDRAAADAPAFTYRFCDDGTPAHGGRDPNPGADRALAVPAAYQGVDGLPPLDAARAAGVGGQSDGMIALDVDVTLPDPKRHPPGAAGYPLIALMHGCCGGDRHGWESDRLHGNGEKWHYNSVWWASRGYVVLTWTSRGFVSGSGYGSTGEAHLDSHEYEINDFQHLAGQLADDPFFSVDPSRVVVTGGSYGGGLSWQVFTDPIWRSPAGKEMRLAAVAPKYGWTDVLGALLPTGRHIYDEGPLPAFDGSDSGYTQGQKVGMPIRSIINGLFLAGDIGAPTPPPNNSHTTFANEIREAYYCGAGTYPIEGNPLCAGAFASFVPNSMAFRSAYYRNGFFEKLKTDPRYRVPVFSAATFTDPLFPPIEHRRMADRLKATVPGYPIKEYHGDVQHFVQNKAKEWGDICGADRHVCTLADYPGGNPDAVPNGRLRVGATTLLNEFIDHYARPAANPKEQTPVFDTTASLQICPATAVDGLKVDEPGETFTADSFDALTPGRMTLEFDGGGQQTTSDASPNGHATATDPVVNSASNGNRCPVHTDAPGPGVAVYDSPVLERDATMIGGTIVSVDYSATGDLESLQLNARLYDVLPDGRTAVMADRGPRRIDPRRDGTERVVFQLHGNGWRFKQGHRIRIELAQDDDPYLHLSNPASAITIKKVKLEIPVRETVFGLDPTAPPAGADRTAPTVSLRVLKRSTRRRLRVRVRCSEACRGTLTALAGRRRAGRISVRLNRPGTRDYKLRLRAVRRGARVVLRAALRDPSGNRRTISARVRVR